MDGTETYCLSLRKSTPQNITVTLHGEKDAGFAYLMENGYPNKSITGDRNKDIYITQAAVWWYLDDTTGSSNLSKAFRSTGSDSNGLRKYIKSLVSGAKTAKSKGYENPSLNAKVSTNTMSLTSDGQWYVTKAIDANAKNIKGKYKVSVSGAPTGTVVVDVHGKAQSSFTSSEKFKIGIPVSSIKEGKTESVKVKIEASGTVNKAYKYNPKDSSVQPIVVLDTESKDVTDSLTVKATRPKSTPVSTPTPASTPTPTPTPATASILKLDKDTNAVVSGAVLVVKNASGTEIAKFTSTSSAYKLDNLANGTYTVEEVTAPTGYELSTTKETFTITDSVRNAEVKFYNKAKSSVVTIKKLDKKTNQPVAGAVLAIKDANGNEIKRITTSINGNSITGLSNGTYTVEEVEAPAGYELSTEKETFTLSDSSKSVEVKFYNTPKDRTVTIAKVDSATGNLLAGAVIVVTNEKGEEVARFTSTKETYVLKDLADGTYTVEEVEAPNGYFLNEEKQSFTIDNQHLSYQITIKDVPKTCENGGLDDNECYVEVPNTGSNNILFYTLGIAIMITGIGYVYKRRQG